MVRLCRRGSSFDKPDSDKLSSLEALLSSSREIPVLVREDLVLSSGEKSFQLDRCRDGNGSDL